MSENLFILSGLIFFAASVLYSIYFIKQTRKFGILSTTLTVGGFIFQIVGYLFRWMEASQQGFDHTPLEAFTIYEVLIFISFCLVSLYLVFEYKYRIRALGCLVMPFITLMILYASFSDSITSEIQELPDVLQGNYFMLHVVSGAISYAGFCLSVIASVIILMMTGKGKVSTAQDTIMSKLPRPMILDDISYKSIALGFILFSVCIATGLYRTKVIWGSYWSWDPSQTSMLITWLMY